MAGDRWITRPHPAPHARLRLFCFPYAGAGASLFRAWPPALAPEIEVCPVQLPGREHRLCEAPYRRLAPLAAAAAEALRPYLDLPFAFFGHSMGALISFELARTFQAEGREGPRRLCVSGCRAPQLPSPDPPIHELSDEAFLTGLRRLNGTPEAVLQDEELMQLLMPALRADFAVCETYRYDAGTPLSCGISAFGGAEDEEAPPDAVSAWQEQTRGGFTHRTLPGGHFFFNSALHSLPAAVQADLLALLPAPG